MISGVHFGHNSPWIGSLVPVGSPRREVLLHVLTVIRTEAQPAGRWFPMPAIASCSPH